MRIPSWSQLRRQQHPSGGKVMTLSIVSTCTLGEYIESKLANLVTGIWKPTSSELEDLLDHLTECAPCQIVLGVYVAAQRDGEEAEKSPQNVIDAVLSLLVTTIHETHFQNDVGPYIEVFQAHGEEAARKQFPMLAVHLERCKECQINIEEACTMLREAEEAGIIELFPIGIY